MINEHRGNKRINKRATAIRRQNVAAAYMLTEDTADPQSIADQLELDSSDVEYGRLDSGMLSYASFGEERSPGAHEPVTLYLNSNQIKHTISAKVGTSYRAGKAKPTPDELISREVELMFSGYQEGQEPLEVNPNFPKNFDKEPQPFKPTGPRFYETLPPILTAGVKIQSSATDRMKLNGETGIREIIEYNGRRNDFVSQNVLH